MDPRNIIIAVLASVLVMVILGLSIPLLNDAATTAHLSNRLSMIDYALSAVGVSPGQVLYVDSGNDLAGDSDLTFSTDTLTVTNLSVTTGLLVSGANVTRAASYVVAANDSLGSDKAMADFVCSGSGDQVEIQAAIDSLPSGQGGRVLLMAGNYSCSGNITVDIAGVTIEGESWPEQYGDPSGASISFAQNQNGIVLSSQVHGLHLRNLRLSGYSHTPATTGVRLTFGNDMCRIENTIITGFGKGIYATDCDSFFMNTARVVYNDYNLYIDGTIGCEFSARDGFYSHAYYDNIYLGYVSKALIYGNEICSNEGGIGYGINVPANSCYYLEIFDNRFEGNSTGCIYSSGSSWLTVHDNYFDTLTSGYAVNIKSNNARVYNNIFYAVNGIHLSGLRGIVRGNYISSADQYGVTVNGTSDTTVADNIIYNAGTSAIYELGTNTRLTLRNNAGFVTENYGKATISGGTQVVAIAHGLAITPEAEKFRIVLLENPLLVNCGGLFISDNATATTFWVSANGTVTDDLTLGWNYSSDIDTY